MKNEINPSLPLVGITNEDLAGFLFIYCPEKKGLSDFLNEFEFWICTEWAADSRKHLEELMEVGKYRWTETELDEYEANDSVISPITMVAFLSSISKKRLKAAKREPWEIERMVMDLYPKMIAARYNENADYKNAADKPLPKEVSPEGIAEEINKMALERKKDDELREKNRYSTFRGFIMGLKEKRPEIMNIVRQLLQENSGKAHSFRCGKGAIPPIDFKHSPML